MHRVDAHQGVTDAAKTPERVCDREYMQRRNVVSQCAKEKTYLGLVDRLNGDATMTSHKAQSLPMPRMLHAARRRG